MKYLYTIVFLLTLFLGGCNKQVEFIREDSFANFAVQYPSDTTIRLSQYDTLKISPVIGGIDPDRSYHYEWKLYVSDGETRIISTDRNIAEEISLPEGSYTLQFSATETASGVVALSNMMYLNVTGIYYEGWLVANNVNEQGYLSFLRTDGEIFLDPLQDANGKKYHGKVAGGIAVIADGFYNRFINQIMYFTDRGLTMFDPASLLQLTETNGNLFAPLAFNSKPAFAINSYTIDQYFIGNGGLYAANIPFSQSEGSVLEQFSSRFSGDYDLFPYIFLDEVSSIFVYDNNNKKFLIGEYNVRELYEDKVVGKTMIGADETSNDEYLVMFKNDADYTIARCALTSDASTGSEITEASFTPVEIDDNPSFAASSEYTIGYFSAGNKLYSVNAANGNVILLHTFAEGSKIADIKMSKEGADANRKLVVGVNNANNGEVYYIYLGTQGSIDNSRTPTIFKGFGTIVQLNYRTAS